MNEPSIDRAICVHGHFYQPPRENAWLECIQVQPSAHPYHDWNCRTTAECYRPNGAARILNDAGQIRAICNNYASISFDFGPTLLSWLKGQAPDAYARILDADRQSQARFGGHGSAMAQAYNHVILPLANDRDRDTQVCWGRRDFEHRFGRRPQAMWLPETAVNVASLETLAQHEFAFVVLAPHQARRVRRIGSKTWKDLSSGAIDTSQAYRIPLPSGRSIDAFFYNGPLAHDLAFGDLLNDGNNFARRLTAPVAPPRARAQLVNLAIDGETWGHHHRFGEMGLAYALAEVEKNPEWRITNYGQFRADHPPTREVEIVENTSWSCAHGVERWRSNCGCNAGSHEGWHQRWRQPLRESLDWLRDRLAEVFESQAAVLWRDPWAARNDYIDVILDRSEKVRAEFFARHGTPAADGSRVRALEFLEMQRHTQLMYTSCGWFFDDISGLETTQVLQYAARAIELCRRCAQADFEREFLERLAAAPGNLPEAPNGRVVYEKYVVPARLDGRHLAANFAMRFVTAPELAVAGARLGAFELALPQHEVAGDPQLRLDWGRLRVASKISGDSSEHVFAAFNSGDEHACVGLREPDQDSSPTADPRLATIAAEDNAAAAHDALKDIFGDGIFCWSDLLPDEQARFFAYAATIAEKVGGPADQTLADRFTGMLVALHKSGAAPPPRLEAAVAANLRSRLLVAFQADPMGLDDIQAALDTVAGLDLSLDGDVRTAAGQALQGAAKRLREQPADLEGLNQARRLVDLARSVAADVDVWDLQNVVFDLTHSSSPPETSEAWHAAVAGLAESLAVAPAASSAPA